MLLGLVPGLSGRLQVVSQPPPLTDLWCPVNPSISRNASCTVMRYDYTLIVLNCTEPVCNIDWPAFV